MTDLAELRTAAAAVLRMKDPERDAAFDDLVRDLEEAARHVGAG